MESKLLGLVVPIPTLPFCITLKRLPLAPTNKVEVAMREPAVVVPEKRVLPWTESKEEGEVVPTPVNPF